MSWREDTRVNDLDMFFQLEVTCRVCKKFHYVTPLELVVNDRIGHLFIDELQSLMTCHNVRCSGPVWITETHDSLNEGFVAGQP
ncbi:MAG: hypothetical protein AAGC58_04565 [Asticcacaulis sp.]